MEVVDVRKELFEEVELLGKKGLFTELRVDKATVPEGMHCYELRHGDDDGFPVSVEEGVRVNYFGAVLFTDKMELGKEKAVSFGYEDFGFTGEHRKLGEYLVQAECKQLGNGVELMAFMEDNDILFHMTEPEAELLCGYLDGHGYSIGQYEGKLYRGDLCAETDRTVWEETTIDDLVDCACEWNYELVQEARAEMENPENFRDFANKHSRYEDLCADERVLDSLFDRTKYAPEIEQLAEQLADEFIRNLQSKGNLEEAVGKLAEQIKQEPETEREGQETANRQRGKAR